MTNFKINSPTNRKNYTPIYVAVALLIMAGIISTFFYVNRSSHVKPETTTTETEELTPDQFTDETESTPIGSKQSEETTAPDQISSTASIKITENSSLTDKIRIAAEVSEITPTNCIFTFSYTDSRPVTKSVSANEQTCGPIEISYLEFDRTGEWNVSITAYNQEARVVAKGNVGIR